MSGRRIEKTGGENIGEKKDEFVKVFIRKVGVDPADYDKADPVDLKAFTECLNLANLWPLFREAVEEMTPEEDLEAQGMAALFPQ